MNYLKLALKFGPWIAIGILSILLWTAHTAIGHRDATIKQRTQERDFAVETVTNYSRVLDQSNKAIRLQNERLQSIVKERAEERRVYEAKLVRARADAKVNYDAAASLLDLQAPEGELAQCRAARDLLERELVK